MIHYNQYTMMHCIHWHSVCIHYHIHPYILKYIMSYHIVHVYTYVLSISIHIYTYRFAVFSVNRVYLH